MYSIGPTASSLDLGLRDKALVPAVQPGLLWQNT